jgi:dCTP deaminase
VKLSNREIVKALTNGDVIMTPPPAPEAISVTSIDVHLGPYIYVLPRYKRTKSGKKKINYVFDTRDGTIEQFWEKHGVEIDLRTNKIGKGKFGYELKPDEVCLAMTLEHVNLPLNRKRVLEGKIWSRSRTGRAFIRMHVDAPEVKPGTNNPVTLEIKNDGPITYVLWCGDPLASIGFDEVKGKPTEFTSWVHGQTRASGAKKDGESKARLNQTVRSRYRGVQLPDEGEKRGNRRKKVA